jgi:uncharacterized damage-inducible protein DinB
MDLRYPIGTFAWSGPNTPEQRTLFINEIAAAPAALRNAVRGLSTDQLETPYRPGGWTVRQVVHHVPESHMNSYIRFKLALTEDTPTIKPYDEAKWAELGDVHNVAIDVSLKLLESLHDRWVPLLKSLSAEDFLKTFNHPEIGPVSLDKNVALYAWHGAHHIAHITSLRERMGWT